jgi:hypothetical protein
MNLFSYSHNFLLAHTSILLAPVCSYILDMKIGALVRYFDMFGAVVHGVAVSDVFMNTEGGPHGFNGEAIWVAWTDGTGQTAERLETLLDPEECIGFA